MPKWYMSQSGMGNEDWRVSQGCLPFLPWSAWGCPGRSARVRRRERLQHHQALLRGSWKEPAPSGHWAPPVSRGQPQWEPHPTPGRQGNSCPPRKFPSELPGLTHFRICTSPPQAGAGEAGCPSRPNLRSKIHLHRSHQRLWWCPQCRTSARPAGSRGTATSKPSLQPQKIHSHFSPFLQAKALVTPNCSLRAKPLFSFFFPWGFSLSLLILAPLPVCVGTRGAPCGQQPKFSPEQPGQALEGAAQGWDHESSSTEELRELQCPAAAPRDITQPSPWNIPARDAPQENLSTLISKLCTGLFLTVCGLNVIRAGF